MSPCTSDFIKFQAAIKTLTIKVKTMSFCNKHSSEKLLVIESKGKKGKNANEFLMQSLFNYRMGFLKLDFYADI